MLVTVGFWGATSSHGFASESWWQTAPGVHSWTGCYAGAQAGITSETDGFAGALLISYSGLGGSGANGYGATAGAQLGCNYQLGMLVVGLEGDGLWSGVNNNSSLTVSTSPVETALLQTKNNWNADVAMRVGVAFDRLLAYGKGGIAWGRYDFTETVTTTTTGTASGSGTLPGVLMGIGLEYAIFQQWSAKIEYNYIAYDLPLSFSSAED